MERLVFVKQIFISNIYVCILFSSEHDQQHLSTFIKHVHKNLKVQSAKYGTSKAWTQHCEDENTLKKYADYMKTLATLHWDNKSTEELKANSRNEWIVNQCKEYFFNKGIEKQRIREQKILHLMDLNNETIELVLRNNVIRLLDVGSCYNPFKNYDIFDVLAIDIAPANYAVYKCDFTNVQLVNELNNDQNVIQTLLKNSYDTVVFSLLLDYLPSPELRLNACSKAYELLKTEGIMIVILPDSKHVGANAKYMKSWRHTLSTIGFSRIKYEKLAYIHCMLFRKSLRPEIPQRWANLHSRDAFSNELCLPQDFNYEDDSDDEIECTKVSENPQDVLNFFQELPDI